MVTPGAMSQKAPMLTSWPIETLRLIREFSAITELLEIVELAFTNTFIAIFAEGEITADG